MSDLPITTTVEEDDEVQVQLDKLARWPKLALWFKLFMDRSNKDTYGNRTGAALIAYNLDRTNSTSYNTAGVIGCQNYKKLKNLASLYYEQEGLTVKVQLDMLAAKAAESKSAKFMEMLLQITNVYEPKALIAIQNNTLNHVQVTPSEEARLDKDFAEFLEQKYNKAPVVTVNSSTPQTSTG